MGKVGRIIRNAEIEIRLARHQEHLLLYGMERLREIAVVKSVAADIAVKPSECLRIEVRRAALRTPLGPIGADEGFEIGRAKRALVDAGTVESLAQAPGGINVAKGLERQQRLARKAAIARMLRRGFERAQQAGQKNFVVIGCAGAAADHEGAYHHFGGERRPMIGLHTAHRKSINGGEFVHAPHFPDQPLLPVHGRYPGYPCTHFRAACSSNATEARRRSRGAPRAPMIESPTGAPPAVAPGRLTCGAPVRPPWLVRQPMRSRKGSNW